MADKSQKKIFGSDRFSKKSERSVAIVSVFNRGVWAAAELRSKGLKVDFFDMTSAMGNWPPEDIEGPFGFSHHHRISSSFLNHLNILSPLRPVDNGLSIWTKELPFQLKSPLIREQLTQRNIFPPETRSLHSTAFEQNWLKCFASQWASKIFYESYELDPDLVDITPYQREFSVRSPSRADGDRISTFLNEQGVRVMNQGEIVDFSFGGRSWVSGFELQGEEKGLRKIDEVIWCLSSEETSHLSKKLMSHLYEDVLEAEWTWIRFRVEFSDCEELSILPLHFNLIEDLFSPWTHANWLIAQRTALKKQFDFWMRIPAFQRFNKNYLFKKGNDLKEILSRRLAESSPEILSYPQEYYYSSAQMGPSRWVQYDKDMKKRFRISRFKNVHFSSPETWVSNQWVHRFESENAIVNRIHEVWQKILSHERGNEVEL